MQLIVNLAAQFERNVAFVGRGVQENAEIAQRLGYLKVPAGRPDSRQRRPQLSGRATSSVLATGIAGRADGGAVAHRD